MTPETKAQLEFQERVDRWTTEHDRLVKAGEVPPQHFGFAFESLRMRRVRERNRKEPGEAFEETEE